MQSLETQNGETLYNYALIFERGLNGYSHHSHAAFLMLMHAVEQDYPPALWDWGQRLLEKRNKKTAHPSMPCQLLRKQHERESFKHKYKQQFFSIIEIKDLEI